ncbi:hypothetical protein ARMGADRAFT_1081099 [Armillaria gallica]|uniref:Uncharacterized protein n=1 Tax=Armillaria gallica TaxID=47427 RepID=A0A2H3DXX9_ARMGA|nr:hypothetical protein ARMGADRAFT_1081099 [Armillaria gallica]
MAKSANSEHTEPGGSSTILVRGSMPWSIHKYSIPNLRPIPLDTPSPSLEPESHVQAPVLPRTIAPLPPLKLTMPLPQKERTPAPQKPQSMAPVTPLNAQPTGRTVAIQRKLMSFDKPEAVSNSGPSYSTETFQKDWTSPLHSKPAQQLKTVPLTNAMCSGASSPTPSQALAVNTANRPNIIQGPDPSLLCEGSVLVPSNGREPLFLPGTDDEEDQVPEDLMETSHVDKEVAGTDGEDGDSPPPTNLARRLRQEPRISFVFNDTTGDFVDPHPTIFLPRPVATPSQCLGLRHSTRPHVSPVNLDAAYLKLVPKSNPDAKKKKRKNTKGKVLDAVVPCKCARTEDDTVPVKDKPAPKKPKLKETIVVDEDEPAVATKVVHRRGPGLLKPLPITLGVSSGGFGEKVPSSAKVVKDGIQSIGMLVVDKDFGDFVEVDKSYWSKAVAPFVGEWYTTAFKCVRCHYSKLPCKVDGVPALNPIEHYRPKGSDAVNTFEAAVNAIEANNTAIAVITQQYLAGLSVFAHTDNIHAQTFHLRGCLAPIEENEDDHDSKDEEYEAPDDVAEGESSPSKKRKSKSG